MCSTEIGGPVCHRIAVTHSIAIPYNFNGNRFPSSYPSFRNQMSADFKDRVWTARDRGPQRRPSADQRYGAPSSPSPLSPNDDRVTASHRGNADIHTVLNDVLALTKLNHNACIYGDGQPVTLSFADAVGEILTAGPVAGAPTPFKLYI